MKNNMYCFPTNGALVPVLMEQAFATFASDIEHLGFRGQASAFFNGSEFYLVHRPDGDLHNYWLYESLETQTQITVFNT